MALLPNLTRRYLAILAAAALLAVGGQVLVQATLQRQARHFGAVAWLMRHRALTSRTVQGALALGRGEVAPGAWGRAHTELADAIARLRLHEATLHASEGASLPRALRPTLAGRVAALERADDLLVAAVNEVRRLATALPDAPARAANAAALQRVLDAQTPLLALIADGSRDIVTASHAELVTLRRVEVALTLALLVTLALGGVLVVRPAARSLEGLVRELLASREALATAHAAALQEREFSASLVNASVDGILAFDRALRITEWNRAMEAWTGVPRADVLGRNPEELLRALGGRVEWGDAGPPFAEALAGHACSLRGCRGSAGRGVPFRHFDISCVPVHGADGAGEVVGGLLTFRDVSDRAEMEARLSHQAYHDPLTGLANRARFRECVERALAVGQRGSGCVAVVYVDLDDFKKVNDSLGHAAGDRLLHVVGERLLNATRGSDTVARLGGDEFAILVENARTDDDVLTVADRIVRAMRAPVSIEGKELFVGASVGVARATAASPLDARGRAEELLQHADVAMYRAKSAGKGRHVLYEQGMLDDAMERLELESELRHAVERGELRLHYQPIVELDGERVTSVEALVRWQHPRLGLVPPARFLELAEETGLIVPLGRWVLGEACRQTALWRARLAAEGGGAGRDEDGGLSVAVNISGRQLREPSLVADVRDALLHAGLPAEALLVELPERVFMQCDDTELERLRALKALGVRLGIDDFGTGYASLSYLHRFPVDVLKIDRSFVEGVTRGGSDAALARAVIALSDMLSVRTVAEGIARPQQQEQLRTLGCELGQGYLFAHPVAPEELEGALGLGGARVAA